MSKLRSAVVSAAALLIALTAATRPAWAAPGSGSGAMHGDPTLVNPVITGPPPVTLPGNCPAFLSSDWVLNFTGGGNAVSYGTSNKNGDWGGANAEGPAALSTPDSTVQYAGHLHVWFGGGQNSNPGGTPTQQWEQGFTLEFDGTGIAGNLTIHANMHTTTNDKGITTNNILNINVVCS